MNLLYDNLVGVFDKFWKVIFLNYFLIYLRNWSKYKMYREIQKVVKQKKFEFTI